jgi:predicted unusual protein kinase regulating ubiquinone biosynthesis (AarF/ABC1/UbiB family)
VLRHLLPRFTRDGRLKNVDWQGVIDEFERVIGEERDYDKEIANAEQFRANFASWEQVYVPKIYPELSTRQVITMEYIPGVKVDDHAGLKKMGLTPMAIAERLVRSYLKQLLEDGFFHADPHPGNLRVMPDGRLAFFDFGMVGRIPLDFQSQLVDAFFHIVERDWEGLTRDAVELGFLRLDPSDKEGMDRVMRELLDQYEGVRLGEKDFQELHSDVANVLYNYPFQIPAKFTFILRAIMTLDGIGMKADPDFNFFAVAKPHAKEFMLRREGRYMGARVLSRVLRREEGSIDWKKAWKLAKMAWKYYVDGR